MQRESTPKHALSAFLLAAGGLLVLAAVAWAFTQQTLRASAFVSHTQSVLTTLAAAESSLYRAEAAHRAYMIGRRPAYQQEREARVVDLRERLQDAKQLTEDNPAQQRRLADLAAAIDERIAVFGETQQQIESGAAVTVDERLDEGARLIAGLQPRFAALVDEERRLLGLREKEETDRTRLATLIYAALMLSLVILLPLVARRLRNDIVARGAAEAAAAAERRYDELHKQALTLYNAETDRQAVLEQTLALLDADGGFPAACFYRHDEWSDTLQLASARGAPADVKTGIKFGEGPIGDAARHGRSVSLATPEATGALRVETGLATLRPAALLVVPVQHQAKLLGVLALAAARTVGERELAFVERLAAQLGVALHNLGQFEGLNLLAEQLRERGEDVARKNALLERASRMKSEFLANMSHELRTPLNAIIGFSEIMRDGLAGDLTDEQGEYVGDIYSSGKHLLALINDILDLSKIEAGQMQLELDEIDPAELVVAGSAVVRERAGLRRITLTELCPSGLGRLLLDARRAKQIVYNLLSNAVKFTPEGGRVNFGVRRVGRAEVEAAQAGDDARLFPPAAPGHDHYLELSIADSGIGIAPAALQELFQPFVQIDSALSRQFEGTGLGLTMALRLTELHGGGLLMRSQPGEGTQFTVWLPWRERESLPALVDAVMPPAGTPAAHVQIAAADAVDAAANGAPLVLVIEDDPRAASLVRRQLESQGFRVTVAQHAESGLQAARERQPQAIVLDVVLPGMDGWDMLGQLKAQAETAHIPVVIVSITDEPKRGFALGAAQVLVKPVTQDDLLAALAAIGMFEAPVGRGRVLVVDDDPKAVTLVCKHLQSVGFEALGAYGGQEALDLVRREPPDAIVLDLMMPHVSGFDVVEALALQPQTAGIPIVVLTAQLVSSQDRELLRGRVQRIMEKSQFHAASLVAEVRRALAKRQAAVAS